MMPVALVAAGYLIGRPGHWFPVLIAFDGVGLILFAVFLVGIGTDEAQTESQSVSDSQTRHDARGGG